MDFEEIEQDSDITLDSDLLFDGIIEGATEPDMDFIFLIKTY